MQLLPLIQKVKDRIAASLSLQRPHKAIISAVILFCTTQAGLHFWPSSSLVYGVRVDYLAPTIYLLDCLVAISLLFQLFNQKPARLNFPTYLIPALLLNLLFSANVPASLTWSLRALLDLALILNLNLFFIKKLLPQILVWLAALEVSLALLQVILGRNLGGVLYYLGERSFSLGQPGIALSSVFNHVVLRGYGTFSHPNILAGWLVISLLIYLMFSHNLRGRRIYLFLVTLGVFLTASRSAGLALFGLIIPFHFLSSLKSRSLYYFLIIVTTLSLGFLSPDRGELSLIERLKLEATTKAIIYNRPIFGAGVNASISLYPSLSLPQRLLQPGHNSATLTLSWLGLLGTLALFLIIGSKIAFLKTLLPLLPILLLDHYLLTSPQGIFIFILYLRLALNYSHVQKNRE